MSFRRVGGAVLGALLLLSLGSCGRTNSGNAPSPQPEPGTRVNGSERLAWDQPTLSGTEVTDYQFAAYVDNVRVPLTNVVCGGEAGENGHPCTSDLPSLTLGRHTIAIVAIRVAEQELESPRSPALVVTRVTPASAPSPAVITGVARIRVPTGVAVVASRLDEPRDLAVDAAGRVFVAERDGRVHIIERDGRGSDLAAIVAVAGVDQGLGLLGIALHPRFERNRFVYLALTADGPDGGLVYQIVRTREVGGTLGEAAVLLDSVPATAPGGAAMRFGPDGALYVAVADLPDGSGQRDAAAPNGKVLRLTDDGLPLGTEGGSSPVYGEGVRVPTGLAIDPVSGAVFVAGTTDRGDAVVQVPPPEARGASGLGAAGAAPHAILTEPGTGAVTGLASRLVRARGELLAARGGQTGRIERLVAEADRQARVRVLATMPAPLGCLSAAADGAIYFCISGEGSDAGAMVGVIRPR
jgi:hypothetical protein